MQREREREARCVSKAHPARQARLHAVSIFSIWHLTAYRAIVDRVRVAAGPRKLKLLLLLLFLPLVLLCLYHACVMQWS